MVLALSSIAQAFRFINKAKGADQYKPCLPVLSSHYSPTASLLIFRYIL
jgi:hypothetical protein